MRQSPEVAAAMQRLLTKEQIRRLAYFVGRDASGVAMLRWLLDRVLDAYEADRERTKTLWINQFMWPEPDLLAAEAAARRELDEIVKQHSIGGL